MKLMLTRSSQRNLNIGWEPCATSTPLKIKPKNVIIEKELQKEFQIRKDSFDNNRKLQKGCNSTNIIVENPADKHLVTKRPRKNKSYVNFDFSSSSDEDSASEKKRPVIKLSFRKQANLLLNNKKSDVEDIKVVKNINTTYNYHSITCAEANKCDFKSLKENYNHIHDGKKKKQNVTRNLASKNLNTDEESQIFNKVKDSGDEVEVNLERKESTEKYINSDENVIRSSNCKFKINKSEKACKRKQKTHSYINNDSQSLKSFQKLNFEDKTVNRKSKNTEHTVNSVKIIKSKNAEKKLGTPHMKKSRDNVTSLQIMENKTNTSHQLFSDSKEQELINILDLTSEEMSEAKESNDFLYKNKNKLIYTAFISPHPSNQTNFSEKPKNDIPKRRHSIKKHKFAKNLSKEPVVNTEKQYKPDENTSEDIQEPHSLKKNEEFGMSNKGLIENSSRKNELSFRKTIRKTKKNVASKVKKKKETFTRNTADDNINSIKLTNTNADVKRSLGLGGSVIKNHPAEEGNTTAAEKPVFKLINELSYKEDEAGCSAAECWDVNTFKCGVFKLKINAQMNCRTLHKNSHLGGVLVKGNLRMKIGSREVDLSQGDMAFVPPLTEWQTTNIGVCESVFYYWCGRFKI